MADSVNTFLKDEITSIREVLEDKNIVLSPVERLLLESNKLMLTIFADDHIKNQGAIRMDGARGSCGVLSYSRRDAAACSS